MSRIHILGASGSGTTTLGTAIADRLGVAHEDSDTYFWLPTEPPFTTPRAPADRAAMVARRLPTTGDWVFSGSAIRWTTQLEPCYDLIVFMRLDPAIRMQRLRLRETARYGARVAPGGDLAVSSRAFLDWAEAYDSAGAEQRSLAGHEAWLATQTAPLLRLDSSAPVPELIRAVLARL